MTWLHTFGGQTKVWPTNFGWGVFHEVYRNIVVVIMTSYDV